MSDSVLNELKRRWKATGDSEDHAAYIAAALRAGRMDPSKLRLLVRARAPEAPAIEAVLGPVNRKVTSTADGRDGENVVVAYDYDRWVSDAQPDQQELGSQTFFDLIFDDLASLPVDEKETRRQAAEVAPESAKSLLVQELLDGGQRPAARRRRVFGALIELQKTAIRAIQEARMLSVAPSAWGDGMALFNVLHGVAGYLEDMVPFGVYLDLPGYVTDEMIPDGESDDAIAAALLDDDRFLSKLDWPANEAWVDRQTQTAYFSPPPSIIWLDFYHFLFKRLLAWLRDEPLPAPPPLRTWI